MFKLFSRLNPTKPPYPVPEEPSQPASPPGPDPSHQTSRRRSGSTAPRSGPSSEHRATKKPSVDHESSVSSQRSTYSYNNYSGPRKLWDTEDTFLPRAKPAPPLPKLEKHKHARSRSQHQVESSLARSSVSTEPSLCKAPILDTLQEPPVEVTPKRQRSLTWSTTQAPAPSWTSDKSSFKRRKPPPSLVEPVSCVETEANKPAKKHGSRERVKSNPPIAGPSKPRISGPVPLIGGASREVSFAGGETL